MCLFLILWDDFASILLGNSFVFTLFTWADCTDGNIVFRCDSDKNSLVIILYVLKVHFLKHVEVIILFLFYTVHVDQVWLSNVPMCPAPLSQLTILISFTLVRPRPLPHTRSRRGTRGTEKSSPCVYGQTGHFWRSPPPLLLSGFLLKAAPFYCIFSSTRRALEVCTSHSSSGCSTAFFPLHYTIDVSFLIIFSLSLTFLALDAFLPNVEF